MKNVKLHRVSRLGLKEKHGGIEIHKVSRLGISSNTPDCKYLDSFISNTPINIKKLIGHLSANYFENNKFVALKNYTNIGAFITKKHTEETIEKAMVKKDNLSVVQNKMYLETIVKKDNLSVVQNKRHLTKPVRDKEQLLQKIEDSYYKFLSTSFSLNNTKCYINNDVRRNGYSIHLDQKNKSISYRYSIYYKASEQEIKRTKGNITANKRYKAIILKTGSVGLLFFFIEKVYGKIEANNLRKSIYEKFILEFNNAKDVKTLMFLYDELPSYIKLGYDVEEEREEKPYKLPDELLWKHFMMFVAYDKGAKDASYYVLNVMTLITPKFCMKKFLEDQSIVIKVYDGLDDRNAFEAFFGIYPFSETYDIGTNTLEPTNKDLFVTLINAYVQLYENDSSIAIFESSGAHFHQGTEKKALFGREYTREYTLDSNILFSNTKENKVSLKNYWKSKEYLGPSLNSDGSTHHVYSYGRGSKNGYYNPLDVVKFTQYNDKGETVTINVPVLFVKHASDVKEWERVNEGIRLGVNVLMIIAGAATIYSGAGSLMLYAAIADMGLATTDIIIQNKKEEGYFKTKEGKEFLESWEKIYTIGGVVTFSPVAIKAVATYGPKIVSSGADLLQVTGKTITNPEVYKRIKNITTKAIHSLEIPNFSKTGLEILKKGFKNIPELTNAKKLQELGVIFAKNISDDLVVIYKNAIIAVGKAKEVAEQLREILKLKGEKLLNYLKELVDVCVLSFQNKKFIDVILFVTKNRVFKGVLTIHEEAIIMFYTTSAYETINKALRGLIYLKREYISFERLLNKALDKLPNSIYNGSEHILYRSVEISEELMQKLFLGKTEYIEKAFFSTSYDYTKFLENWFQYEPSHNVIFKIQGKNGKLVETISDIENEAEVLFKSKTKFEIIEINPIPHPFNQELEIYEIILKEK